MLLILLSMLASTCAGFLAHLIFYPFLERSYTPRTARLTAYVIGMFLDMGSLWFITRSYCRWAGDRRKMPVTFERYMIVRSLSAISLGMGVLIGYLLDD